MAKSSSSTSRSGASSGSRGSGGSSIKALQKATKGMGIKYPSKGTELQKKVWKEWATNAIKARNTKDTLKPLSKGETKKRLKNMTQTTYQSKRTRRRFLTTGLFR